MNKTHIIFTFFVVFFTFINAASLTPSKNDVEDNESRIVSGEKAQLGEFKGAISIQFVYIHPKNITINHICTGTLIKPKVILTAARCFVNETSKIEDPSRLKIIGDDLSNAKPHVWRPGSRQTRNATKIVVHANYNTTSHQNDIALVIVDEPFTDSKTFSPVTLSTSKPGDHEACSVAGWGSLHPTIVNIPSVYLLKANVHVIPKRECNMPEYYHGSVKDGAFCADSPLGKRLCKGDEGAGLICGGQLKGIASLYGCHSNVIPGVYTDVSQYKQWIHDHSKASITSSFAIPTLLAVFVGLSKFRDILFN